MSGRFIRDGKGTFEKPTINQVRVVALDAATAKVRGWCSIDLRLLLEL